MVHVITTVGICVCPLAGRIAALGMVGQTVQIHSVPFFWTMLLGKSFRYTGIVES